MPNVFTLAFLFLLPQQPPVPQTQTPPAIPTTAAPFDPTTLVQKAMDRLHEADNDYNRFTMLERQHLITVNPAGKTTYDYVRTYESTWINGLPYLRLVKFNDKPLASYDEAQEQKLYDEALAERKNLGDAERTRLAGLQLNKSDVNLDAILSQQYTLTELSHDMVGGEIEHVIEAHVRPFRRPKSKCSYRFRLWISDKDPVIRRYTADVPDAKSEFCRETHYETIFTLVDGVPKPNKETSRFHIDSKTDHNTYINEVIFTNYRRFAATVTIKSAAGIDNPESTPKP